MSAPVLELTRSVAPTTVRRADDPVGNDGLTDAERTRYANQYRQGPAAEPSYRELSDVAEWLRKKRAQVG